MVDQPDNDENQNKVPLSGDDENTGRKVSTGRLNLPDDMDSSPDAQAASEDAHTADETGRDNDETSSTQAAADDTQSTAASHTADSTDDDNDTPKKSSKSSRASRRRISQLELELLRETAILSKDNPLLKRALNQQTSQEEGDDGTGTRILDEKREIILLIRGMVERVVIRAGVKFKLGRFELGSNRPNEIDLTPYGALDRGVSRVHAQLHLENRHLYITDLGSTNGTYLAGKKLEPNEPTRIKKGDELLVGRLAVQILFR
jgi:hypothetical protein